MLNQSMFCHSRSSRESIIKKASANGRFLIFYIYNLIFNMNFKMQNEPKFQTARIPVSPYSIVTSNFYCQTSVRKNKPKQTQIITSCLVFLCVLCGNKKMTNKPNFKMSQIHNNLMQTKELHCAWTHDKQKKTNPKRTQSKHQHTVDSLFAESKGIPYLVPPHSLQDYFDISPSNEYDAPLCTRRIE